MIPSGAPANTGFGSPEAIADFNGDGRPDFLAVTFNFAGQTTQFTQALMLQKADGTFTMKEVHSIPAAAGAAAAADVDGDGKVDVVTVVNGPAGDHGEGLGPATLVVCLGNGNGTFRAQPPIDLPAAPEAVAVMVQDVNRDGKPDIITVSSDQYADAVLQTFLNWGGGKFSPGPTYGNLTFGYLLAAADFNGDGVPDLAVRNDPGTQILLGKKDGSFTAGPQFNFISRQGAARDLNGDHRQDLVLTSMQSTRVLLGKGDGTFTPGAILDSSFGLNKDPVFSNEFVPTGLHIDESQQR